MTIQKAKERARVIVMDPRTKMIVLTQLDSGTYLANLGAYLRMPVPSAEGEIKKYVVTVERLPTLHYKKPYEKRVAAQAKNLARQAAQAQKQKIEKIAREEKLLVLRRAKIMNQVELAFLKQGKNAMQFITCDKCNAPATILMLTHLNPGSAIIGPEQITGAVCSDHDQAHWKPFKTQGQIECSRLEFFYDGLRQIYINKPAAK